MLLHYIKTGQIVNILNLLNLNNQLLEYLKILNFYKNLLVFILWKMRLFFFGNFIFFLF